jgi:hypothetical protein
VKVVTGVTPWSAVLAVLAVFVTGASTVAAAPKKPKPPTAIAGLGYHEVFVDDFDTFDRTVWEDHIWYESSPDPAWQNFQYVSDGVLHLTSRRADKYPNNVITTLNRREFTGGYFEARLKWTGGNGTWPGFWLVSQRHAWNPDYPQINGYCAQNGLPAALCYAAEIDVMEAQGSFPDRYWATRPKHQRPVRCPGHAGADRDPGRHEPDDGLPHLRGVGYTEQRDVVPGRASGRPSRIVRLDHAAGIPAARHDHGWLDQSGSMRRRRTSSRPQWTTSRCGSRKLPAPEVTGIMPPHRATSTAGTRT